MAKAVRKVFIEEIPLQLSMRYLQDHTAFTILSYS